MPQPDTNLLPRTDEPCVYMNQGTNEHHHVEDGVLYLVPYGACIKTYMPMDKLFRNKFTKQTHVAELLIVNADEFED